VLELPAEFAKVVLCELEEMSYEEAAQAADADLYDSSRLIAGELWCWRNSRCCGMCRGARAWRMKKRNGSAR